jgi:hypothetical protein
MLLSVLEFGVVGERATFLLIRRLSRAGSESEQKIYHLNYIASLRTSESPEAEIIIALLMCI